MQKKDFITRDEGMSNVAFTRDTALNSISLNWLSKYVSVNGQIVVRTCQSGSLKYHKYQDIESEVEEQWKNGWQKTCLNDCEQS